MMSSFRVCLLFLSVLLTVFGCSFAAKDNGLINDFGEYKISGGTILKVMDNNGLLDYQMLDKKGKVLFETYTPISLYHRWGMYVDDTKTLWVFSSDRGNYKWAMNTETGDYEASWLEPNDIVPDEILKTELKRFLNR